MADAGQKSPSGGTRSWALATLARYVAALGGRLEVRAVFPEETVTLLEAPGRADPPTDSRGQ